MKTETTALTQNQKLLWIGQELNPESPLYNMVMTYEIEDAISVSHFKLAFQKLVAKSDTMRSIIQLQNEEPIQKYVTNIEYEVSFEDFSANNNPKEFYKSWERQRAIYQFDIQKCLFDCVLIKLSENRFIWYINMHHLITDGWSTTIIFSEMSRLYTKAIQDDITILEEEKLPSYQKFVAYTGIVLRKRQFISYKF